MNSPDAAEPKISAPMVAGESDEPPFVPTPDASGPQPPPPTAPKSISEKEDCLP